MKLHMLLKTRTNDYELHSVNEKKFAETCRELSKAGEILFVIRGEILDSDEIRKLCRN